jgi:DNA-damage-inducible protein J
MATANAIVRARINQQIKEEASIVLASMGLTVSDAFRLMMTRIAIEKELPFHPLIPNAETIAAIKRARRGGLKSFDSIEALMEDLHDGEIAKERLEEIKADPDSLISDYALANRLKDLLIK